MKKGFTLIELLGVIIILAVLAVLITPKIIKIINKSEETTRKQSAYELLKVAEYKANNLYITNSSSLIINYTEKTNVDKLEYTGEVPEKGEMTIMQDGNISMAVKLGNKCYIKEVYEKEIRTFEYDEETCINKVPTLESAKIGLYESEFDENRYIFRGPNPNNRIYIKEDGENNTLYRIIAFESDGTIKVIRDEKLSSQHSYDSSNVRTGSGNSFCTNTNGCNVWGKDSTTFYNGKALTGHFYYVYYITGNTTTLTISTTGKVGEESSINKYLNTNSSWQALTNLNSYIEPHEFNAGGIYEVSKGFQKEQEEEKLLKWKGKVGLLTVSEYVEASLNPACTDAHSNYNPQSTTHCKESNWLYKNYNQWTMTADTSSDNYVWMILADGNFDIYPANNSYGIRPTFYLKKSIVLGGKGTTEEPYYIIENR